MPEKTIDDKIYGLRLVQWEKAQKILSLQKQFTTSSESEKITIQHAISSIKHDYDKITESIDRLLNVSKPPQPSPKEKIFNPLTCKELLALPEKEWILDQIFGLGDLGMIYGPPGCGKTFVVIDMIIHMFTGSTWAGRFHAKRPINVAYCAGEGVRALPARFGAALKNYEISDLYNFEFHMQVPNLYDDKTGHPSSIFQFISELKERQQIEKCMPLDLLIIDTLHTATTGVDENSSQDMGHVLKACRMAIENLGCAVLLVHHTNKGGTAERGSSALRGAMDFMLRIDKIENSAGTNATMFCSKLKDGEQWKEQGFYLESVVDTTSVYVKWNGMNIGTIDDKTPDKARLLYEIKKKPGFEFTIASLTQILGKERNYVQKLVNQLVDEKKCKSKFLYDHKKSSRMNPLVYFVDLSF
jgi:AAA domain-containing protein